MDSTCFAKCQSSFLMPHAQLTEPHVIISYGVTLKITCLYFYGRWFKELWGRFICDLLALNVGCFDEHVKNLILELKYARSPTMQKTLINLSITWIDSLYHCMKLCAVLVVAQASWGLLLYMYPVNFDQFSSF